MLISTTDFPELLVCLCVFISMLSVFCVFLAPITDDQNTLDVHDYMLLNGSPMNKDKI